MLEDIFASKTRARLMEALVEHPEARFSTRELIRRVGTGASSVQRELQRLERAGVVRSERAGNARVFSAEPMHTLYPQLRELVAAATGGAVAMPGPAEAVAPPPVQPAPSLAPEPERPDPRIAALLEKLVRECRAHDVTYLALFGVSTESRPEVEPRLDIVIRFSETTPNRFDAYFDLSEDLDRIMGMPVRIVEDGTVRNPELRQEIEQTRMVLYDLPSW